MRGTHTTETVSIRKSATQFKLAQVLTTVRLMSSAKHGGNVYGAPYGVIDVMDRHVTSTTGVKGLTFSNDV